MGRNACFELDQRRVRGQLAAANGEAESVARHRIDEAGRITRQQHPGAAGRTRFDAKRARGPRRQTHGAR